MSRHSPGNLYTYDIAGGIPMPQSQSPNQNKTHWIDDDDFLAFMRDMDFDTDKAEALLDELLARHNPESEAA
jgi:hypothetical protein